MCFWIRRKLTVRTKTGKTASGLAAATATADLRRLSLPSRVAADAAGGAFSVTCHQDQE